MPSEHSSDVKFEIGHVLFIDIVGYSKLLITEQSERLETLKKIVRGTEQFRVAEAEGKLLLLPTGDGGALVFRNSSEAPVLCALEISEELKNHPELRVRMGIHSGPVNEITDLNEQANIAGAGINLAQRVMDCGDADHILLSKHVADDLEHYPRWRKYLHELGECEIKHGTRIGVVNFYADHVGNAQLPKKFQALKNRRAGVRWAAITAALLALAAIVGGITMFSRTHGPPPLAPEKSIAVLPFYNQNHDPNADYLCDGIPESIINSLSELPKLKVMSRNSVFHYKGKETDAELVARELKVQTVLSGRVRQRGDDLTIGVELINAQDNSQVWGRQYNRKVADVFVVQEEIANQVSEKLRLKLTGAERQQLSKRPTENIKAFQYYMQGRSYAQRRTRDDLLTAIRYCEQSIGEDQNYALAYAGLADAHSNLGAFGYIAPIEGRRKAEEAARKALSLDENLAEAHAAFGQTYIQFSPSNFALGDRELRRAIELSPSLATAHFYLGISLVRQGRFDEGLEELLKAREFDPLSSITARAVSLPYYLKRDYARALELLRQASELGPAFSSTFEIGIYIQNKLFDEALPELERAKRDRKNDPILIYDTAMVYAAQGKRAEALQMIKDLEEMSGANLSEAQWIAKIYAALNEKEQALSWLERGLATGAIGFFYKDEPVWDSIRSDPRFEAVVAKVFSSEDGSTR
jgi:TolB-like protein/Flp pilus assembly protein TadD